MFNHWTILIDHCLIHRPAHDECTPSDWHMLISLCQSAYADQRTISAHQPALFYIVIVLW